MACEFTVICICAYKIYNILGKNTESRVQIIYASTVVAEGHVNCTIRQSSKYALSNLKLFLCDSASVVVEEEEEKTIRLIKLINNRLCCTLTLP